MTYPNPLIPGFSPDPSVVLADGALPAHEIERVAAREGQDIATRRHSASRSEPTKERILRDAANALLPARDVVCDEEIDFFCHHKT